MRVRVVLIGFVLVVLVIGATLLITASRAGATNDDPVVIVAGTNSPESVNEVLRARLAADGMDAHIFVLPDRGLGDIAESSAALAAFVDEVLLGSGTDSVDLVGHSQGGLVARHYVKQLGGDETVDSLITLGTPNHGTALANIADALGVDGDCESCGQMAIGSDFLDELNAGDDTIGSVAYTNIYTSFDQIVFPAATARMDDGATNVLVQSQCLLRVVGHVGLVFDGAVYDGVRDALEHERVRLNCFAL